MDARLARRFALAGLAAALVGPSTALAQPPGPVAAPPTVAPRTVDVEAWSRSRGGSSSDVQLRADSAAPASAAPSFHVAQAPELLRGAQPPAGALAQPGPADGPPPAAPTEPARVRLPLLGDSTLPLGQTPTPSPETLQQYARYVDGTIDPNNTLYLVLGRPRVVVLKESPVRIQVANPRVADFELITETQISLAGLEQGSTVLNLWFRDPAAPEDRRADKVLSYLVHVIPDPEQKERLERSYQALEQEVNRAFPNSVVRLSLVGDKLVVRGEARDVVEAQQIIQVISANAPRDPNERELPPIQNLSLGVNAAGGPFGAAGAVPALNTGNFLDVVTPEIRQVGEAPTLGDFLQTGSANIINLLRVPGEQQVMLRVSVAEVNRSAARAIGADFSIANNAGTFPFRQLTAGLAVTNGAAALSGPNLPISIDGGQFFLALRALRNLNLARSLAEPNLVTMNGQPAAFQAGGQFPVPSGVASFGAAAQGVAFVPFGVTLRFVPQITDRDRVRLNVAATVSTRDPALATNIGGNAAAGGTNVSGLNSRTFSTTVELREGQTLAVAGLLQQNFGADSQRVPLVGDWPLVGNFWGRSQTSAAEQELVILVTPELVSPLEACQTPPLPGADVFEPSDLEFFLQGRLESRRSEDFRSPARTDKARLCQYETCEDLFIIGAQGQTYGCCTLGHGCLPTPAEGLPYGVLPAGETIIPGPRQPALPAPAAEGQP